MLMVFDEKKKRLGHASYLAEQSSNTTRIIDPLSCGEIDFLNRNFASSTISYLDSAWYEIDPYF